MPRRGMHLPKDSNPLSHGIAASKPDEEEVISKTISGIGFTEQILPYVEY